MRQRRRGLSSYQNQLIPGLLQTEATARALFQAHWPPPDDETVEERVAARLERQRLLETKSKFFNFVMEASVLSRRVGSAEDHKEQLLHLLTVGKQRNVVVQIVPSDVVHPGLNGPFVLLETADHDRLAYEEGQAMGALYADPQRVSALTNRYAMILGQALSPEESARFISKLLEEL
ncbi:DUF5753 domain-containing protein [Kitasatospora mediocidica]|uniref:DUF5753 domain-containing protein n=1 Tax=Kitasatospora mediocidica TaxID=58352 RepID=UPI002FBD97B9